MMNDVQGDLMAAMALQEDTIVAPASAVGGGVAIVRLSGPDAVAIAKKHFRAAHANADMMSRELVYGTFSDAIGLPIDDCMVVIMSGPHSFTGEDVAEIQCHGGHSVVTAIVDACRGSGARFAEPGEFSRRAFLNGKMDLAQAEALGDLIAAQTELSRRSALQQLRGGLSGKVRGVRDSLVDAAAEIEAHLDFPEEDIPELAQERIASILRDADTKISELLAGYNRGRMVREGARVVLAGAPNAGKSSLFNALIGRERAIVSPHAGTTRDTIEATIDIGGIPVTLIDTAGLRESIDEIEQIGIERTSEEMGAADLVLLIVDCSGDSEDTFVCVSQVEATVPVMVVYNKSDQVANSSRVCEANEFEVSAVTKSGLEQLIDGIGSRLIGTDVLAEAGVTRARHADCLHLAQESLGKAFDAFSYAASGDLVMVDLRDAIIHLGEILGERLDEQILDRIFSTFCLGK